MAKWLQISATDLPISVNDSLIYLNISKWFTNTGELVRFTDIGKWISYIIKSFINISNSLPISVNQAIYLYPRPISFTDISNSWLSFTNIGINMINSLITDIGNSRDKCPFDTPKASDCAPGSGSFAGKWSPGWPINIIPGLSLVDEWPTLILEPNR